MLAEFEHLVPTEYPEEHLFRFSPEAASSTLLMYDNTAPDNPPPGGATVAAGYAGGPSAYRAWTDSEWASVSHLLRLPIWVDLGNGSASSSANDFLSWLRSHNVPKGVTVSLDFETSQNSSFVRAFDSVIHGAGYLLCLYGSLSTIFSNPTPSGGIWDAVYNNVPHISSGAIATQYESQGNYDLSLIESSVPLWGGNSPAPVVPDDMIVLRHR